MRFGWWWECRIDALFNHYLYDRDRNVRNVSDWDCGRKHHYPGKHVYGGSIL
jgi:hypothetical protein